jgi:hypothetical protein
MLEIGENSKNKTEKSFSNLPARIGEIKNDKCSIRRNTYTNTNLQIGISIFVARLRNYFVFARLRDSEMVALRDCAIQILKISATFHRTGLNVEEEEQQQESDHCIRTCGALRARG